MTANTLCGGLRRGLPALAAALLFAAVPPACITPRSVHAYYEGAEAEAAGDLATAEARYTEAATGQDRLVGAELARIALMARSADRKKDADELLAALRKKAPAEPLVCAFSALYALREGDSKAAAERLASARSLRPDDPPETLRAFRTAQLAVAAHRGDDAAAQTALAQLPDAPTPTAGIAALAAAVAWNAGQREEARRRAPAVWPAATEALWLAALLARESGDLVAAVALLRQIPDVQRPLAAQTLLVELHLRLGQPALAAELAGTAARLDPANQGLQELWAVTLLQLGEAGAARDVLAAAATRSPSWSAHYHLGLAYVQLGELTAAERAFAAAAVRCPTCKPAVQNRDALRRWLGQ